MSTLCYISAIAARVLGILGAFAILWFGLWGYFSDQYWVSAGIGILLPGFVAILGLIVGDTLAALSVMAVREEDA